MFPFSELHILYTKKCLQDRGYCSVDFSHSPNNITTGSRELLLAFGWVLSTQKVFDKALDLSSSPLDAALPVSSKVCNNYMHYGYIPPNGY